MAKRRGRGEGSIERLPSGRYRAVLVLGKDPKTGRRVRLTATKASKSEALSWLRERQNEAATDSISVGGRITLKDWVARWLTAKQDHVEPATMRWYRENVDRHITPRLGEIRLCDLNAACIHDWHSRMTKDGVTPGEQFKAATALRNALGEAVKIGLVSQNHASRVKRPKVKRKEVPSFTHEEAQRVLAASSGWFGTFVRLGFDAGMRPGELFALHWSEVDLDEGTIRVKWAVDPVTKKLKQPKTDKGRRKILVGAGTIALLRTLAAQKENGDLVFPNARGGILNISNVSYKLWKPLLRKARVPSVGLYSLRHTSATLLLAEGINVKVVSERLGHESIAVTLKFYAHALPSMQSRAAEVANRLFG